MRAIHGVAQHYAWGDRESIPQMLGREPDGRPWAEWWVGTHPGGPATLDDGTPLVDEAGELPYLVKLLAADEPLSLQAHPDRETARAGYAREQSLEVDDPARIYRDPNAKPELLCALTEFDALCGFRPVAQTAALLRSLGADELARTLLDDGLEPVVSGLYRGTIASEPLVRACAEHPSPEAALVRRLDARYPGEPSVAVTLLLNRVLLEPGEALYFTPGNLHAYVHGVGVEVMGASDNVVRGGLTPKHVDVEELLRVLRFEPLAEPVVRPERQADGVWYYPTPGAPFAVLRFEVAEPLTYTAEGRDVLLCTAGDAGVLHRGESVYLHAGEAAVLRGPATVWAVTSG